MKISIITVNYNGKHLLKNFLDVICNLNYDKKDYEIILVDNGSTDDSVDFVKKNYPEVRVICSKKNLGFGIGNNLGIRHSKGDLVFLVNSDTVPDKDFLKNIVGCYQKLDKLSRHRIGAVAAKLVLIDRYLPLKIVDANFTGYKIADCNKPQNDYVYVLNHEITNHNYEYVSLPFNFEIKRDLEIELTVQKYRSKNFEVSVGDMVFENEFRKGKGTFVIKISLGKDKLEVFGKNLIQNAGNFYFRDGYGRDRGVRIFSQKQYYEIDEGQYDKSQSLQGFCGAGVLLNKKALEKVGLFDPNFFMYYEDGDLSFRMRKNGWKIYFCPKAVIRHIHSASSLEWSPFFNFHTERGRLLLVIKHWPRLAAIREWFKFIIRDSITVPMYYLFQGNYKRSLLKFTGRLKVNLSLVVPFLMNVMAAGRFSKKEIKKFY